MAGQPLVLEGLVKSYGKRRVLDNLSFTVQPGEIYGFVGANGAGKTTTMRIALGVLSSDGGRVSLGNTPMNDTLRRTVGYMPEERGLYPKEKVAWQLQYIARLHGVSKEEAIKRVSSLLKTLGIEERADDRVDTLSLGNQQRVQLAAALVHDPDVLVLDEPFSGLDPVAVEVMSGVLRDYADQGVPVVFSSHQLDLVERLCDRVGILRDGTMLAEGTVTELRSQGPTRLRIGTSSAPNQWPSEIPGVAKVETTPRSPGTLIVTFEDDAPPALDQQLLHQALSFGPVTEFGPAPLPLTVLYQEVISK